MQVLYFTNIGGNLDKYAPGRLQFVMVSLSTYFFLKDADCPG